MERSWSFVVWIVILAIPVDLVLASWSRSRRAGAARIEGPRLDDPREP